MSRPVARSYAYCDEHWEVLYEKVRYESPKDFRIRRPDGRGGFLWDRGPRRLIYRLPDLLAHLDAFPDSWVWVAEGEKDADALWQLGLPATTNDDGAKNWTDGDSLFLTGRRCVVCEDNDQAGRDRSKLVAGSLLYHGAAAVRVLRFTELAEGGDVSDWIRQRESLPPWHLAEFLIDRLESLSLSWHRSLYRGLPDGRQAAAGTNAGR